MYEQKPPEALRLSQWDGVIFFAQRFHVLAPAQVFADRKEASNARPGEILHTTNDEEQVGALGI